MSRTNPQKKKRRSASSPLLFFGEGMSEKMFLNLLKKYYSFNSGVAVNIKKGKGGCAYNIVIDADKVVGAFDRKIVILDNDKPKKEMEKAKIEAKNRNIEIIENTPCLEFLLISILDKEPIGKDSKWCKKHFEDNYIEKKKRREPKEYEKLFSKDLLEKKKVKIKQLKIIILVMQGK